MVRVNEKLVIWTLVLCALLGSGVVGLRYLQVKRTSPRLLKRAEREEAKGDYQRALSLLYRYLSFAPRDNDALARYGLLLEKTAVTKSQAEQVLVTLEQVVNRDPGRADVRRNLAFWAMSLGRTPDARFHAEALLSATPNDGELELLLGRCDEAEARYPLAAKWYEKAKTDAPALIESYVRLAVVLRSHLNDPRRAEKVLDEMVRTNGRSYEAYYSRGRYRNAYMLPGSAEDIERALELAPDQPDVLLAAAESAGAKQDWPRARGYLERARKVRPLDGRIFRFLATLEIQAGDLPAAEKRLLGAAKTLPADLEIKWLLGQVYARQGKISAAREVTQSLFEVGYPQELLDLTEAEASFAQGDWVLAARRLEAVRPLLITRPELSKQTDIELAKCYEEIGDNQRRLSVLRRMTDADPGGERPLRALAASLETAGRTDEAILQYRRLPKPTPEDKIEIARLTVVQALAQAPDRRDWRGVEQALAEAERAAPDSPQVPLLRAETLTSRDRFDEARALLEAKRKAHPEREEYWLGLASVAERRESPAEILPLLDAAERQLGDRVELRLARARYAALNDGANAPKAVQKLTRDIDKFAPEDRARLIRGLTVALSIVGDPGGALAVWDKMAAMYPGSLGVFLTAFDLAVEAGDQAAMASAIEKVRRIEGTQGELASYCRVRQLLWQARGGDKSPLTEARKLLAEIALKRPDWSLLALAEAEVEELSENRDASLKSYIQAINQGERNPTVVRKVLQLLFSDRRYDDANRVLAKIQDRSLVVGNLRRMAAELLARNQDYDKAVVQARRAVETNSKSMGDYVWLGQMLDAVGRKAEAEAPFRRAVELADGDSTPYVVLTQYLTAAGRKDEAVAVVADADRKLSREQDPLGLARCHELIGRDDEAGALFRAAVVSRPSDPPTLRNFCAFLIRTGKQLEAEPYLQKLVTLGVKSEDDAAWARRLLAILIVSKGDPRRAAEALDLLGNPAARLANGTTPAVPTEDLLARARVLSALPGDDNRQESIRLLQEASARETLSEIDQLLLARLFEEQGEWPKADSLMQSLLKTKGRDRELLSAYLDALLRNQLADRAGPWLERLEEAAPRLPDTRLLKARVLYAQGKAESAVGVLNDLVRDEPKQTAAVTQLLESVGQVPEAERVLRERLSTSPKSVLDLATFLGRHGKTQEALDLCDSSWKSIPPETVALACIEVLERVGGGGGPFFKRVEERLDEAIRQHPKSKALNRSLADIRTLEGRYQDAQVIYRDVIKQDPGDVTAMNNLAWLLAHEPGKGAEALSLSNRAIELTAAHPMYLDTRAAAELSLDQIEPAIRDIQQALKVSPTGPLYFHLARAYSMQKKPKVARDALQRGQKLGLNPDNLDPFDKADYRRLTEELARKP